ncbi:hypothetical protein B0H34DRAFT_150986 [Crassisporium funariophilum]|nr:hypothetical protein B0H34DRAFT_150986 [Crassisporium funariophilum]
MEYPVTRKFKWRWFTPISLLGACLVIAILSVVNLILTGYETITSFQSDFNVTQPMWYDRVMPFRHHKPGTLCDRRVFNVGDSFTTDYAFFQWSIDSILKPNAGSSGILYSGVPLTFCDVTSVYVDGSMQSWSIDFTVIATCKRAGLFQLTGKTSFTMGLLAGRYSPLLGLVRSANDGTDDIRGQILNGIIRAAVDDIGMRTYNAYRRSNFTTPATISFQANFESCPMNMGAQAPCAVNPPKFEVVAGSVIYANASITAYDNYYPTDPDTNPWVFTNDTELPFYNLLQSVYAAVRVDMGNPSANNFILHREVNSKILTAVFPVTEWNTDVKSTISTLFDNWNDPTPFVQKYLPFTIAGPARIQVVYPCRFQQRKTNGSLFISVLVATLSMFSTGWAIYMVLAAAMAKKRNPTANRCEEHTLNSMRWPEPPQTQTGDFDPYEGYRLQRREPTFTPNRKDFAYESIAVKP